MIDFTSSEFATAYANQKSRISEQLATFPREVHATATLIFPYSTVESTQKSGDAAIVGERVNVQVRQKAKR